jgi:hypothetical protein
MRASKCHAIPQAMQQHGGISKTAKRREQPVEERSPTSARNADQSDAQAKHDGIGTRATA